MCSDREGAKLDFERKINNAVRRIDEINCENNNKVIVGKKKIKAVLLIKLGSKLSSGYDRQNVSNSSMHFPLQ